MSVLVNVQLHMMVYFTELCPQLLKMKRHLLQASTMSLVTTRARVVLKNVRYGGWEFFGNMKFVVNVGISFNEGDRH